MWELDYKESWAPKFWCFWTVVLKKTLESPLDCKEIQPDHPEGDQSWVFIGRTDAEAETPILWPLDMKNWFIWKDPDDGNDWGRKRRDNRRWGGWMASLTQWTWINWVNSQSWHWTGRPGVLMSMRSQRVRRGWGLNWIELNPFTRTLRFIIHVSSGTMVKNLPAMWDTQFQSPGQEDPMEKGMQPLLVFLPGEFHGQRSLVYSPQGCKESDMTEWLTLSFSFKDRFTSTLSLKVYEAHCYMIKNKSLPPNFSLLFESPVLFILIEPTFSFK